MPSSPPFGKGGLGGISHSESGQQTPEPILGTRGGK